MKPTHEAARRAPGRPRNAPGAGGWNPAALRAARALSSSLRTLAKLSAATGISVTQLSMIGRARDQGGREPTLPQKRAIARAFRRPMSFFERELDVRSAP